MKKKNLLFLGSLLFMGFFLVACEEDDDEVSSRSLPVSVESLRGKTWTATLGLVDIEFDIAGDEAAADQGSITITPLDIDNFLTTNADDKIFANSDGIEFALSAVEPFDYIYLSGDEDSVTNTVPVILLGGNISAAERAKFVTFREAFNDFRTALIDPDVDLDAAGLALKAILMPEGAIIPDIFNGASSGTVDIAYPLRVANITESGSRRDALVLFSPMLIYVDGATATGALHTAIDSVIGTANAATTGALTGAFDVARDAGGTFLNGELSRQDLQTFLLLTSQ